MATIFDPHSELACCHACGSAGTVGTRFCGACGAELPQLCPVCKTPAAPGQHFCADCGAPLALGAADKRFNTGNAAERRLMTVVFCDLVGSSALSAQLDPEDFAALLVAYRERCARAVTHYGGYVSRYVGDGILACFGYPRAVGRDAQSAVACGLTVADEISALARETKLPGGASLAVRIGIETGLVVAGRLGPGMAMELDALVGAAPNTAARLQQLALSNQVVIGEATYELVSADFRCEEVVHRLDLTPPTRAFVIYGTVSREGRPLALARRRGPMVGRAAELAKLQKCWSNVVAGKGQTVIISGEPGIGKSRLAQELLDCISDTPHEFLLLACAPTGKATALHAAVEALRRTLDAAVEASSGKLTLLQALANLVVDIRLDKTRALEVLAEAVGIGPRPENLEPSVCRYLLLRAMKTWLLQNSARGPLLILAEDLHWSDPTLIELLHDVTISIPSRRVMLLATRRSDFASKWQNLPAAATLALKPLGRPESKRLIDVLAGSLSSAVCDTILARSDGIPLFLEEFALTAGTPAIPRTLQQLFRARLDALGQAKRLAQCAAVLGRLLETDVLAALAGLSVQLVERYLAQLVGAEVLIPMTVGSGITYTFRHALLQQAINESVLLTDRRALHSRAAALLPVLRPALVERQPEVLAEHHEAAGELAAALPYHVNAARRGLASAALEETEMQIRRGLATAMSMQPGAVPEAELELRLLLGQVLIAKRGYASAAVQEAFESAVAVAERVRDETRALAPLRGLLSFYQVRGPLSRAGTICDRLVVAAERSRDPYGLVDAWRRRGWNRGCMGRLADAEEDLSRALTVFDPARMTDYIAVAGQDPRVLALANLCWLDPPRHGINFAAERAILAAEAAYASSHPVSACYGFVFAALTLQRAGQWEDARSLAQGALTVAAEKGFVYWVAMSHVAIGYDQVVRRGDFASGRETIRNALASYRETQGELLRPFILWRLAEVEMTMCNVAAARAALQEAIQVAESLEAYGQIPELLLRQAQLRTGPEQRDKRQQLLTRALEAARGQGADAVALGVAEEMSFM